MSNHNKTTLLISRKYITSKLCDKKHLKSLQVNIKFHRNSSRNVLLFWSSIVRQDPLDGAQVCLSWILKMK